MTEIKNEPLLAICHLIAWLIVLGLLGSLLIALGSACGAAFGGDRFETILRQSYPQLHAGVAPLFALAMLCIAIGLALIFRFMLALIAIIRSVQQGEAFTLANVARIRLMAWISLAGVGVGLCIAGSLGAVTERLGPHAPDGGIHIERFNGLGLGWGQLLMTLLLFVLARLFAQAAAMRTEIEGTV
jgi:hypothetical protein